MIGTVRLSIQLFFLFICWIKRQSFLHSAYHNPVDLWWVRMVGPKEKKEHKDRPTHRSTGLRLANGHIKEEEKWMIDRAHIIFSLINVGTDDRSLFIFSFFFVPARLSFPFRRAIHLQMTSWGSIALLLKRKWKRKSFVTVGKTWLIIKWKEPSKAWSQRDEVLFHFILSANGLLPTLRFPLLNCVRWRASWLMAETSDHSVGP